jgi:rubrerythrin
MGIHAVGLTSEDAAKGGWRMIDGMQRSREAHSAEGTHTDGFVEFWPAGNQAKGEYHCADCGYGVTVYTTLPRCPMCSGESWERSSWSPLSRTDERRGV